MGDFVSGLSSKDAVSLLTESVCRLFKKLVCFFIVQFTICFQVQCMNYMTLYALMGMICFGGHCRQASKETWATDQALGEAVVWVRTVALEGNQSWKRKKKNTDEWPLRLVKLANKQFINRYDTIIHTALFSICPLLYKPGVTVQ